MKYGNFVGKYNIPFTAEEKKEIGKTLSAFIDNLPYNISNLFKRDERGKLIYRTKKGCISDSLTFFFDIDNSNQGYIVGRNAHNSMISAFDLGFFITKKGGYLEKKYVDENGKLHFEKDTENNIPFSYSCSLFITGDERKYRHKREECITVKNSYTYGTEISDLVDKSPDDIRHLIKTLTIVRKR